MATLRIDIDESLLAEAESVAADMGMDLETAVRVFLKQMVRRNGLPFRPGGHPLYSRANRAALRTLLAQLEAERTADKTRAEAESFAEPRHPERHGEKRCPICGCLYPYPGRVCPSCAQGAA